MVHFVVLVMSECVRVVENMELDVMELQIGCVPFATKAGKTTKKFLKIFVKTLMISKFRSNWSLFPFESSPPATTIVGLFS